MDFKPRVFNFLTGSRRTVRVKKNIILSCFLKGCSILVTFILVPLTLGYLNPYEYGVWLTLSSILMWINYFDIGLGNGLRNKLAEALALNNTDLAKIYISTTFFLLILITGLVYALFLIAQFRIDWYKILNVSPDSIAGLNSLVYSVFLCFCISFVLRIVGNIYLANQLSAINDLLLFFSNAISLLIIFVLTRTSKGDLTKVAIVYSAVPVLVYTIACFITFWFKYPSLRPAFSAVKIIYSKDLLGLGAQFFVIQIAGLVVFSTSNILITHLIGVEQVTSYNIAFKYFSIIIMIFNIIIYPMWSAITEAYIKKDHEWIRRTIRGIRFIWLLLFLLTAAMVLLSNTIYRIWVGTGVKISFSLSVLMGIYVTITNWNNIYAYFVNGIGKIKLQLYCAVAVSIVYIPVAVFLGKKVGINGIIGAMSIVLLFPGILTTIQYEKIMHISNWSK